MPISDRSNTITPQKRLRKLLTMNSASENNECPCFRPRAHIYCSNCGYTGEGRVRQPCSKHLKLNFINEYSQCPMCKAEHALSEY